MGRPTVVLATEKFADLARRSAVQSGLRKARIATVDHPIGGIAADELERRAERVVAEIMSRWLSD